MSHNLNSTITVIGIDVLPSGLLSERVKPDATIDRGLFIRAGSMSR